MRFEAGGVFVTAFNGWQISAHSPESYRLSQDQADLLARAILAAGRCPCCVVAVDINEGGVTIDPLEPLFEAKVTHEQECTHHA